MAGFGPESSPGGVALLARCMRLQHVAVPTWPLVVEFLVVAELERLLMVCKEPNVAVWHSQFWEARMEQLVVVKSIHVEDEELTVLSSLVR